ncbi:Hypothetical predicted protein, partial [Olea europaea subsp. europaea]
DQSLVQGGERPLRSSRGAAGARLRHRGLLRLLLRFLADFSLRPGQAERSAEAAVSPCP